MPGFPLPSLRYRATDANGHPLASGRTHLFKAGTSSRQSSNVTASGTANDNPVVLDAAGRAPIFINQGVGYKVVQKDVDDRTVFTADNLSVPQPDTVTPPTEIAVGTIVMFGGSSEPAGGHYKLCDGAAVSRATYAALFALIGSTYGAGDASTTFNLPNLKQRFPLGKAATGGTGDALGTVAGAIDHTHTGPSHTHAVAAHTHTISHTHSVPRDTWGSVLNTPGVTARLQVGDAGGVGPDTAQYQSTADNTSGAAGNANAGSKALTTDAGGTGATASANPPFRVVNFLIRVN